MGSGRSTGGSGPYVEGERVFAPPQGSFDADWVASLAAGRVENAVDHAVLVRAAGLAGERFRAGDRPEEAVAALLAAAYEPGVAQAVVGAAWDFAAAYAVERPGTDH